MGYTFNGSTKRITLDPGTTTVDLEDLYSRWKDWVLTSGSQFLQAFRSTGKEADGTGGFTGSYIFIMNGWSIIPQSANHTLILNGNLFRDPDDISGTALIQTVSGYTINIILSRSSLAQGVSTGSGLSPDQAAALTTINTNVQDLHDFKGATTGNPMTADTADNTITTDDGKQITVTSSGTQKIYTRTS